MTKIITFLYDCEFLKLVEKSGKITRGLSGCPRVNHWLDVLLCKLMTLQLYFAGMKQATI